MLNAQGSGQRTEQVVATGRRREERLGGIAQGSAQHTEQVVATGWRQQERLGGMVKTKKISKKNSEEYRDNIQKRYPFWPEVLPKYNKMSRRDQSAYKIQDKYMNRLRWNSYSHYINRGALANHREAGEMDIAEFTDMLMADAAKDIEKKDEYITRLHRQLRAERANARKDRAALMKLAHHYRDGTVPGHRRRVSLSQQRHVGVRMALYDSRARQRFAA